MYENIHPAYYCISLYVYVRCMLHVAREYVLSKSWACLYVWMSTGMYACMHGLVHCACALEASQHLRCYSLCVYVPMYLLQVSILWCVRVLYVQCGWYRAFVLQCVCVFYSVQQAIRLAKCTCVFFLHGTCIYSCDELQINGCVHVAPCKHDEFMDVPMQEV